MPFTPSSSSTADPSLPEPGAERAARGPGRRLILTGAVLAPALALGAAPALADPPPADGEGMVDVELAQAVTADDAGQSVRQVDRAGVTMVGCSWSGDKPEEIAVRGLLTEQGDWSEWFELDELTEPEDGGPVTATHAVWLGGPTASVQVRAFTGGSDATERLVAHLITTVRTQADEDAANRPRQRSLRAAAATGSFQPGVGAPSVISRAGWGADESIVKGSPSYAGELKAAVLHHSEGSNTYSLADVPGILRGYLKYHVQGNGWNDIGYNALVDRFGNIYEGRRGGLDRHVVGAHATGSNTGSVGVCMIGSYMGTSPSDATLNAVAEIMAWKLGGTYISDVSSRVSLDSKDIPRVIGHKDARSVSTDCPGTRGYTALGDLRSRVQSRLAGHLGPVHDTFLQFGGAGVFGAVSSVHHVEGSARITRFSSGCSIVESGGVIEALDSSGNPMGKDMPPAIGAIRSAWLNAGGVATLGRPLAAERGVPGGAQQEFERCSITWSSVAGAHILLGAIRSRWFAGGGVSGSMGFPLTDEISQAGGGARQDFTSGSVYYSDATGAQLVFGGIAGSYSSAQGPAGALGYPATGEYSVPGGQAQRFERGMITWSSGGATVVFGAVYGTYLAHGGPEKFLGLPRTGERAPLVGGGASQTFIGGTIYWSPATGGHVVQGAIGARYMSAGGETWIGYPTTDEYVVGGVPHQDFQRAKLSWTPSGGVRVG